MFNDMPILISILTAGGMFAAAFFLPRLVQKTDLRKGISQQTAEIASGILLASAVLILVALVVGILTWHGQSTVWR